MAPRRAESDLGLQGWIDTLGLKQIFLIYSANAEVGIIFETRGRENSNNSFVWQMEVKKFPNPCLSFLCR